ncbi:MAG TPA: glycosyltransferase [Segeticoccus sp.]|uniref:glycosyltransferase n=1 Tax=Segeticoccus sp. TaxID=2706531 RepID=UPI002D7E3E9F|nr:glycosyltransferase [Segeticoccus sp.]HET8600763.1 glycosyltransferase [Segeticoccus sp.]
MRILLWHVHGSWTTSFVAGSHDYVLPLTPARDADGRGRADTWDWPRSAREVPVDRLRDESLDLVVLQRPHEAALVEQWTGRRPGRDLPAVYVEHNTPTEHAVRSTHPVVRDQALHGIPVVHVTHFNAMAWDTEGARTFVVEHGVPDPGYRYTGTAASCGVVVNEPVRRWRVAGTDLLLRVAEQVPVEVYGMKTDLLEQWAREHGTAALDGRTHDLPQDELHDRLGAHRAYFHPYRWTSLGLALIEAMTLGLPVLALSTTEAPEAVPAAAGLVTNDLDRLTATARRWLHDPDEARERGAAARQHALAHYGLKRFLDDWDHVLQEVLP